jgi:hypothetical protein
MLAASLTIWLLFAFWIIAPHADIPPRFARAAGALLWVELACLLVWSYGSAGCDEGDNGCAPLARAAGVAARTDLPAVAGAFLLLSLAWLVRRGQPPARTTS